MSRAVRLVKKFAKRHHLHITINPNDEPQTIPHSLLVDTRSQETISARGIIDDAEVAVSLRTLAKGTINPLQTRSLISVSLPAGLDFLALSALAKEQLLSISRHLHSDWNQLLLDGHILRLPSNTTDGQLVALKHALAHLPPQLNAEVSDEHLTLFKQPAFSEEAELEAAARLAIELRRSLVTA